MENNTTVRVRGPGGLSKGYLRQLQGLQDCADHGESGGIIAPTRIRR